MAASEASAMTTSTPEPKNDAGAKDASKPNFSDREQTLLGIAVAQCLKGGAPEIDYQKFMKYGNFNTMKTAQNTWGKIKAKLNAAASNTDGEDGEEGTAGAQPKTPKSDKKPQAATSGSKKRSKNTAVDAVVAGPDDEENGSPKKKSKPSPKKKAVKKENSDEDAPAVDDE